MAEAEIEYHDKRSASIYVAFDVKDGKDVVDNDAKFIIWTTTPWTLPSNVAITVHPELTYGQYNVNGEKYIIGKDLVSDVAEQIGWNEENITLEWKAREPKKIGKGKETVDKKVVLPFEEIKEATVIISF